MPVTALSIKDQIIAEVDRLSVEQQTQLLAVVQQMRQAAPPGIPGEVLLAHMDSFTFAPGALAEMLEAIEAGCERIDADGWD